MAAVLLTALVPAPSAPAPAAPEYVALGDSYAAGVGTDKESCGRSDRAYPALFARDRYDLDFRACSGATTADVERQAGVLSSATQLVTVTVGGNDAQFTEVMTTCVLSDERTCGERVSKAERFVREELPGRLDRLFGGLRSRTNAQVVVLGYPRLFEQSDPCSFSEAKRTAVNHAADALAEVLGDRAGSFGFTFVDVRGPFEGHGACGDDPWVNDLTYPITSSYHANAAGHRDGYLPALEAATS
ncbi:lysophospholipase L1-like esterase [Saccharothrix variisporea]|uniref:Lysophospholipase L1-like esterase n=1 Tax=Saccharothrix variisporea TaxID=543527 RepID=A0A495X6F8_9PSEU|nr:lysophospholipase L1-like esterase [Saccharothrix variisporea]